MKLSCLLLLSSSAATAFVIPQQRAGSRHQLMGYLDDLSAELRGPDANPKPEEETREATMLDKESVDRYGVGDWNSFVDFDEFDGGDGQMGVAGDGKKGLDKDWANEASFAKSKSMSAKNAWGTFTGYAEELKAQGVEASRAQQLENWRNQQEVRAKKNEQKWTVDEFDKVDDDWRNLSTFNNQRIQDSDIDKELGEVRPGDKIEAVIELQSRINQAKVYEFSLKNPFMGFSDFRARFTDGTSSEWTVEPTEGALNGRGKPVDFMVKYRPQNPGVTQGYLVVETDEDKWTWQLHGTSSM